MKKLKNQLNTKKLILGQNWKIVNWTKIKDRKIEKSQIAMNTVWKSQILSKNSVFKKMEWNPQKFKWTKIKNWKKIEKMTNCQAHYLTISNYVQKFSFQRND